ncbi:MAG TPA: zf-HC2 domain-containing protein [Gaiellaceae bacterium]|nr:zf-HC2 domain-containing protein [Gaiellaceae bacterium]
MAVRVGCERARQWVSLRLDGELSALEDELLARHLSACAGCRAFAARVRSATTLIRRTPAESPSRRVEPPTPRLPRFPLERRGTALVAAAALALGALVGSLLERPSTPTPTAPGAEVSLLTRDVQQLRELPRENRAPVPVRSTPPNPPEGVI